jgi:cephalosporin hydroxylase
MVVLDREASLAAMLERQNAEGAVKIWEDLERYRAVIAASQPSVIIECGTWEGLSAVWFAGQGAHVVTIDRDHGRVNPAIREDPRITYLQGDTIDPHMVEEAAALVTGKPTMVVLDSDHHPYHVRREIESYGPLVTPGCYMVVEDGIVRHLPFPGPLDAIELLLVGNPLWARDRDVEDMYPVTMHPAGWWRRAS